MNKLISILLCTQIMCLYLTSMAMAQSLQQYTRTGANGEENLILNNNYNSIYDAENAQQRFDLKSLSMQRQNLSKDIFFDDRWTLQLPYPTESILLTTEADDNFIISAGVNYLSFDPLSLFSDLIISSDKGENWTIQRFESNSALITMKKYNDFIWLGGYDTDYNGFLLKSNDLGINWEEKLSSDAYAVLYTNFFDENNGVVLSENLASSSDSVKVLHTTDGGDSWTSYSTYWPFTLFNYYTIYFSDVNHGWIADKSSPYSRIINTTDGGMNWQVQFTDTLEEFVMIHFSDLNNGWAAGVWKDHDTFTSELRIYSTTNGGNDWSTQLTIYDDFYAYFGCSMSSLDSLNSWLAVSNWPYLKVYRTTNGGNVWNPLSELQNVDFQLGEIEFNSEDDGWITAGLGMIYFTSDSGYTWNPKHKSVTISNLKALDFIDSQTGWAASSNYNNNYELIKTENSGEDWSIIYTDTTYRFEEIDFLSEDLGFGITGDLQNYSIIHKTQDGGISWDTIRIENTDLQYILFTDNNNGWVAGSIGSQNQELFIAHTSDSGISWDQQSNINISGSGLNKLDFVNSENGFAVGNYGALIKTTDGGSSWTESWGNLDPNLFWEFYKLTGVYYPELPYCWVTGYSSLLGKTMVAHTTDGGSNWDTLSFQGGYGSGDIFFINQSDGYLVGSIYDYRTTDGGNTWVRLDYPTAISNMFFLNEGLGWAVGLMGRIYKYYDPNVGIKSENKSEIPNHYTLTQNYPNPFNPGTKIKYSIPQSSKVIIKVFDILGNEIETLINKVKPAGTYEITWNAANLPSGVYFYQLKVSPGGGQAGGSSTGSGQVFIQTKKMILLK